MSPKFKMLQKDNMKLIVGHIDRIGEDGCVSGVEQFVGQNQSRAGEDSI